MKFQNYIDLICSSVAEQGYEFFFPSACIPGDTPSMSVMECDLSPEGEEVMAKAWVTECFGEHAELFFAFRAGGRQVHVCWLQNAVIQERFRVHVAPAEE